MRVLVEVADGGIDIRQQIAQHSVSRYMVETRKRANLDWRKEDEEAILAMWDKLSKIAGLR